MFDSFHIQQVSFGKRLMYATIMNPPFLIIIRIVYIFLSVAFSITSFKVVRSGKCIMIMR